MTSLKSRALAWLILPVLALACSSSDDAATATKCSTNADCTRLARGATCGPNKVCVGTGGSSGSSGTGTSGGLDEAGMPLGGPLATLTVSPATASVPAGQLKQFTLEAKDAEGRTPYPYPTFVWSVSGGGTIGDNGLFTAITQGGPYTVKAASGAISATATLMVTAAVLPTITIGETSPLMTDDSGNADKLLAQSAELAQPATIRSLSFYVAAADGNLRLGLYDDSGPNGGPGAKKAETAEFVAKSGWNTANVMTPVLLPSGTYWLAYAPSSNDLHFVRADDGTGSIAFFDNPYGPMPATFSDAPNTVDDHWSFYATLTP